MAMQFQSVDRRKRWIARLNNGRTRWTGIAFGDQGQFFRLGALSAMGGFPRQMLMEDVELALRSKSAGLTLFSETGAPGIRSSLGRQKFSPKCGHGSGAFFHVSV